MGKLKGKVESVARDVGASPFRERSADVDVFCRVLLARLSYWELLVLSKAVEAAIDKRSRGMLNGC